MHAIVAPVLLKGYDIMVVETRSTRWGRVARLDLLGLCMVAGFSISCSGRSHVKIGGACSRNESCTTGVCLREARQGEQALWQGGYCSGNCERNACPSGTCLRLEDGRSYCVSSCQGNQECRSGYVCATSVGACLPDCRLGWSCGSTLTCNANTGTCDPPQVTTGPIGAPCTWNEECSSGLCTPEQGTSGPTYWSGGSCTLDCTKASCPSGSTCVTYESGSAFCSASCTSASNCRSGYVCATSVGACLPDCRLGWSCGSTLTCNKDTGTCDPPQVTTGPIGAPCTWNEECASGLCTPEQGASGPTYWSGGSCTLDCTKASCPSGSTCVTYESGSAFCSASCTSASNCRSGYVCATSVGACLPDCRLGWSCGSTLTCNKDTGTCDPPQITTGPIGAPCSWNEECASGLCTPEQGASGTTYWSGGSCTLDCTKTSCPSGATCVTYESGSAFCSASCTSASDCRSGYVCATSVGACLPDCRLGWSCGSTLSCNKDTGTCDPPQVTPGPIGAPCTWNVECASGLCTPEQGTAGTTHWTGGSCTQDCATVACPSGATCMKLESDGSFCVASCATSGDCRTGYVCDTDVFGCLPDCRLGWSCGSYFVCDARTGMCVAPAIPDGGADAGWSPDGRRDDGSAGPPGDAGRIGPGGPGGPGGATFGTITGRTI
jgi:hypothetical protein